MNQQTLKGNWNELKGKIREQWGNLTEDEVSKTQGNLEQVMGLIQSKTGATREKIEEFFEDATQEGAAMVNRVKNAAQSMAASASEATQEYASQAADAVKSGYEQTQRYVQQRPVESLAVCFGVGLISGVVLALSLRSR
jgi:uncharacterized protein YjbJ (UPF0337 family)